MLGIQIIENDIVDTQLDYTLKGMCMWYRSTLIGLEKWLTLKLGFEVEIFTIIQKEYLKLKRKPNGYQMGDKIIGNKEFIELIRQEAPLKKTKYPI